MTDTPIAAQIIAYTKQLKLPGIRATFQETLSTAATQELGYDAYLLALLKHEAEASCIHLSKP